MKPSDWCLRKKKPKVSLLINGPGNGGDEDMSHKTTVCHQTKNIHTHADTHNHDSVTHNQALLLN